MHLDVPRYIRHFYTMQVALTCTQAAKNTTANLSTRFHQDETLWRSLCVEMTSHPTYLANLFTRPHSV